MTTETRMIRRFLSERVHELIDMPCTFCSGRRGSTEWIMRCPYGALDRQVLADLLKLDCGICSNSCPVVRNYPNPSQVLGLLPHQIMHALGLKLWDIIFSSPMLWNCLGCYQCQEECPERVCVADILCELKNLAMARAHERLSLDGEDPS
jgi:heterodisulfide reductase subunit C